MADVSRTYLRGLGIPDARLDAEALQARGTGTTDSKYQEASPVSGVPEANQTSHMALEASGTPSQEGHLLLTCHRAGDPGLEEAGYYWSDESQTSPADYGWDSFGLVTGWETLRWTTSTIAFTDPVPHAIRLSSGKILTVAEQSNLNDKDITPHSFDPSTETWTAHTAAVTLGSVASQNGPGLCELPGGRVLLFVETADSAQVDCLYSDDDGATWAMYARRVLNTAVPVADIRLIRPAYSAGEIVLFIVYHDGSLFTMAQYGSADLGCSFDVVVSDWEAANSEQTQDVDVVASRDAGFVITFYDLLALDVRSLSVASAFADGTTETSAQIVASASPVGLSLVRDEDGVLYSVTKVSARMQMYRSDDEGGSWVPLTGHGWSVQLDGSSDDFEKWSAAVVGGRMALVTRWATAGGGGPSDEDPYSIGVIWFGGYTTHSAPFASGAKLFSDADQVTFSDNPATAAEGGVYLPIELPPNLAWTASTSGTNTEDLVSPGVLEITTTTGTRHYYRSSTGAALDYFVEFCLEVDAGSGSTASNAVSVQIRSGNSTPSGTHYQISVRIADTGYAVRDEHAGSDIGAATVDITTPLIFRVAMDNAGNIKVWHARPGQARSWTEGPASTTLTNSAASSANLLYFGHRATATATSRWFWVGYCNWPGSWGPATTDFAEGWSSPDDLHPRSFSTTPALVHDGVKVAAVSGPAKIGDSWDIEQDADYPAKNVLWHANPSPSAGHRTTSDESEHLYVFDLSGLVGGHLQSSSIFIALLEINFRLSHLESSDDGAVWTTQISLDAGQDFVTSLEQTRAGDVFSPTKGGASFDGGRYLHAGELVGGTLKLSGGELREILENTSGAWTSQTAAVPYVRCRDVVAGDPSSGSVEIWAPRVLGYKHEITTQHRYWRLRIPATEATAQGDYRIGQLVFGRVHAFGMQYGRGFTTEHAPQQEITTLRSGSTRARKAGPAVRQVELTWTDASNLTQVHTADPAPDYITGSGSGIPLASRGDELRALAGQMAQQDGAATPVVYLPRIDRGTGTVVTTDRDLFLYGRIESPASRSHVIGDEGVDEMERGDAITIREIV